MSHHSDNSRLRSLVEFHYRRNRHLTPACDAEDLFQESWIHLNHSAASKPPTRSENATDDANASGSCCESCSEKVLSQEEILRKAARAASDRVFGRLRKRIHRGATSDRTLDFDPAECVPDTALIMDLKQLIEALPVEERLVIEMLRSGYAGIEIAEQLEVSPQAVTRRKQKAIERLRMGLMDS